MEALNRRGIPLSPENFFVGQIGQIILICQYPGTGWHPLTCHIWHLDLSLSVSHLVKLVKCLFKLTLCSRSISSSRVTAITIHSLTGRHLANNWSYILIFIRPVYSLCSPCIIPVLPAPAPVPAQTSLALARLNRREEGGGGGGGGGLPLHRSGLVQLSQVNYLYFLRYLNVLAPV